MIATLTGAVGSNISNTVQFPAAEFLATVRGDTILWLENGARPANAATYYVTYEAALDMTKRYQLLNCTEHFYQGVAIVQQADIQLMDQTHPIYNVLSIYDNGRLLDRQDLAQRDLRKALGPQSGLETEAPNVADPRFVNPGDFL
jgi:hypothetical protein